MHHSGVITEGVTQADNRRGGMKWPPYRPLGENTANGGQRAAADGSISRDEYLASRAGNTFQKGSGKDSDVS